MIRREILLADGVPRWLLVSQVEHARLSRRLAEHCVGRLGRFNAADAGLYRVRSELLEAIVRHDDGWAAWEARPGIDPQWRRPLSFRELPLGETLANWDDSIARAAEVGPLAAWAVAGHFAALLENSDEEHDKRASTHWFEETAQQRAAWLAEWQLQDPLGHTPSLAANALLWLQVFDFVSLWLCAVCPAGGETVDDWPNVCPIAPRTSLEMVLRPDHSSSMQSVTVQVDPWRFDLPTLTLDAAAHVVPQQPYHDATDLLAAYVPHQLRWTLKSR